MNKYGAPPPVTPAATSSNANNRDADADASGLHPRCVCMAGGADKQLYGCGKFQPNETGTLCIPSGKHVVAISGAGLVRAGR